MMGIRALAAALAIAGLASAGLAQERAIPAEQLRSGSEFLSPDLRDLEDDFANPGMLWVEQGGKLWNTPAGQSGKSCASCHQDAALSMRGVAARYPRIDGNGELLNLEGKIQQCQRERQQAPPWRYESDEMLSATAYVVRQSSKDRINVAIDGAARGHFEAGRALYHKRIGQMNLSCANCHDQNWGKKLMTETISQGHPTGYPVYRMEWQTLGSLERRMRACLSGVRAEMLPYGAPEYRDLALYLAWRAQGLPVHAPGVRR